MKHCFSTEVVDLDIQAPGRNRRESKYFWDELNHLIAAGGFHSIEIPYEPKWDFGGRSGIPRTLRSVTTKFGTVKEYMTFLKENGIDAVDCVHLNPSLFCQGVLPAYFGAFAHFAEEAVLFAAQAGCPTVTISVTPPVYAVQKIPGEETEAGFLEKTGKVIEELSGMAREKGVTLCLKNEYWGLLRGDRILAFMDSLPEYVKLDLDTANLAIAGADPVSVLKSAEGRIGVVHFTDSSFRDDNETWRTALPEYPAERPGKVFTDPGEGTVDLKTVYKKLEEAGYEGTVVFNSRNSYDISRSILRTRYFIDHMLKQEVR